MKRKAVLIGCPSLNSSNPLRGIKDDHLMLKRFLMSPQGGCWKEEEIIIVDYPNDCGSIPFLACVQAHIGDESLDYIFVLYSGHGIIEPFATIFLHKLTPHIYEKIETNEFINQIKAPKALIIIDACMNMNTSGNQISENFIYPINSLLLENKNDCITHTKFNHFIQATNKGQVQCFTASSGESAYEYAPGYTERGSLFINTLLKITNQKIIAGQNVIYFNDDLIKEIADELNRLLESHLCTQTPHICRVDLLDKKYDNINLTIQLPQFPFGIIP